MFEDDRSREDLLIEIEALWTCLHQAGLHIRNLEKGLELYSGLVGTMRIEQGAQTMTPKEAWQDLLEKDDRTSPEECPDMALITYEELQAYMEAYAKSLTSSSSGSLPPTDEPERNSPPPPDVGDDRP